MNLCINLKKYIFLLICCFLSLTGTENHAFSEQIIGPTDVYYLAKSIDDSIVSAYGLTYRFDKKMLSNNIRPRNSYQKLLSVADEFNLLHDNAISQAKLDEARRTDVVNTKPADLYRVLQYMKDFLLSQGIYAEYGGERENKTPSDVTHMLRQISYHNMEIARQKNIPTDWSSPSQVYDAIIKDILPVVQAVAAESGYKFREFDFPEQAVTGIVPRNITRLLHHIYKNISRYYIAKGGYEPLTLIEVTECDTIEAGDSFDLIKAISAEFKAMSGKKTLNADVAEKYNRWKESKSEIVPGDVFRLLQYNYILCKRIMEAGK